MTFKEIDMNEQLTRAINEHAGIPEVDTWAHVPDRDAVVARAVRASEHIVRTTVEIPEKREHIRDRSNRIPYNMLNDISKEQ